MDYFKISPIEYRKAIESLIEEENKTLAWDMKFPATMLVSHPKRSQIQGDDWEIACQEGILTFSVTGQSGKFMTPLPYVPMSRMRYLYELEVTEHGGVDPYHEILEKLFRSTAKDLKSSLRSAKRQGQVIADTMYLPSSAVSRLIPCLCYTARNREFLIDHPHREIGELDLSVYYRVVFTPRQMDAFRDDYPNSIGGMAVSNHMLEEWNKAKIFENDPYNEEKLYQIAKENAHQQSKSEVFQLGGRNFLLMTNEAGYYGAAYAFVGPEEKKIRQLTGTSEVLVLPLSVHEILLYPAGRDDAAEIAQTFHQYMGERNNLGRQPYLPNHVYRLDAHTGRVSMFSMEDTSPEQAAGVIRESDIFLTRKPMRPRRW